MLPTVADVVTLPAVRRGRPVVVAGHAGLTRPVRWAHAAEISDIARLLRGDDLVLTTGIALPEDDAGLAGYVDDLVGVGASGLVVELGRRWNDGPPAAMVSACERSGLPLVTLGRETRFASVTEAVGELVVDAQLAELRFAEEVHHTFDALTLAGASPEGILAEVRRMSGLPVVLESTRHQVLGYDAAAEDPAELLDGWEARSWSVAPAERTAYDDRTGWLVTAVRARGQDWGRLVLVSPEPPPTRHRVLVESAATTLALQRLAARDQESLERQSHRTLLARLAAGDPPDAELLTRCAALGVPLSGRRVVGMVVGPVIRPPGEVGPARHVPTSAPPLAVQERLRDLAELAARTARAREVAALVGVLDDDGVTVLLSFPPGAAVDRRVDDLARELHRALATTPQPASAVVAAGTTVEAVTGAARSLAEARHVLRAAPREQDGRTCHRLVDVHLRGLLHLLADDDRVTAFAEREIGALVAHDAAHRTRLVEAVAALVRRGGNKAAAAADLHLSRPALYDRLARAERVLGTDLAEPESLTALHVAVLVREAAGRA